MPMKTDKFLKTPQNLLLFNAFDALPDFTLFADELGGIVYANPQSLYVIGYTPSEITHLTVELLMPERYRAAHVRHVLAYFANPSLRPMGRELNLSILHKDGTELPVEISLGPIATEQGALVICTIRDISNRKKVETAFLGDERFRLFMKHTPSAVAMFDNQMRYLTVSRRWLEAYQLNDEDILGLSHYEVFPEISDRWKAIHQRCLAGEVLEAEDELLLREDGQKDWVSWKMHPWHLDTGEIGGAILYTEFVTDRKNAELAILESEQRFRGIFNNALTGIAIADLAGKFLMANPAYCKLLGYTNEELCQLEFASLIHPEDLETNLALYAGLIAGIRSFFEIENRYINKNQQTVWVNKLVSTLTDGNGRPLQLLVLVADITERKQAEAKLNSIFNAAAEGIISYDLAGCIVAANASVEALFGYKPEELMGCSIHKLQLAKDVLFFPSIGSGQSLEIEGVNKNGMMVPLDISRAEYMINNQCFYTIIVRDISQRKQREKLDKAHLDELAHVTRVGLMGEMAAGIAHEVSQPLFAIANYMHTSLKLISTKNADLETLADIAHKTQQQALRAGQIIHRMRDFVKSGTEHRSTVDINSTIHDAVNLCTDAIKQNYIELCFDLDINLPPISADHIQIEQVLINLMRNSVDVLKTKPENQPRQLSIHSRLLGNNEIEVRVKDNGPGMDDDQKQKILTPFYTTKTYGMGMGLSICRSLIEAHKGILRFNSKLGKGTTFYFTLPVNEHITECRDEDNPDGGI